jgi:photosystem II stability/assembly factor-like uncharacterized protein
MILNQEQVVFETKTARFAVAFLLLWLLAYTNLIAQDFWQPTNGPFGGDIKCLAVNVSGHVFAGAFGGKVFRSMDNGENWAQVHTFFPYTRVSSLAIAPNGDVFVGAQDLALFRSKDNGNSWEEVLRSSGSFTELLSVAVNSQGHVFAGIYNGIRRSTNNGDSWASTGPAGPAFSFAFNASDHIFVGGRGAIHRSTDNGETWKRVYSALLDVVSAAIDSNGNIFAGTTGGGVLRSTDNGETWTPVNSGLTSAWVQALAVNNARGYVLAGTNSGGIFRSNDNGENWIAVNIGLVNLNVQSLVLNAQGHIFAGTAAGVYYSSDYGASWNEVNFGMTSAHVRSLAANMNGTMFAAHGAGIALSVDKGESWGAANFGLTHRDVRALACNRIGRVFAATHGGGVFVSLDNGGSWTAANNGLIDTEVWSLATDESGQVFAGTARSGVFRSTDNASTWRQILIEPGIIALAINPSGHIFAGNSSSLFRSIDNGANWMRVLYLANIYCVAINKIGHVFVGGSSLTHSMDNGATWMNSGSTSIFALTIDSKGRIYAGSGYGVYSSSNDGVTWEPINSGLTYTYVTSLGVNENDYLFAGTQASGVFRSIEPTPPTSVTEPGGNIPISLLLEQNYPNPFNPETKIVFLVPANMPQQRVALKVFDTNGRLVSALFDRKDATGRYEVIWNGKDSSNRDMASGVYVCRIEAGELSRSKKMILLR